MIGFSYGWKIGVVVALVAGCGPGDAGDADTGETGETTRTSTTDAGTTAGATTGVPTSGGDETSSGGGSSSSEGTTGPAMCTAPPLTDEQVDALAFGVFGDEFEAQPGDVMLVKIGVVECCYFIEDVDACVEYTLTPEDGTTYDPVSGNLTIAEDTAPGTVYTLKADVEDGRKVLEAKISVYTPASNPLVGVWHEVAQLPCDNGAEVPPEPPIEELWFRANGDVLVTWTPFEVYVDYSAAYTYDLQTGALTLTVQGGNYVPPDVDGDGSFAVEDGQLVLTNIWLGSAMDFMGEPACGHRFER